MKYTNNNKPLVCMQSTSRCYQNTSTMDIKGVLWHSTGANNPNLKRYVQPSDSASDKAEMLKLLGTNPYKNDYNHIGGDVGMNAFIGKLADGTVAAVQTMPWNFKPWGCYKGPKGSCNNGWIQFEIAEDSLNDKGYFEKIYNEACELTAYLCDLYNIDPQGTVTVNGVAVPTILCHADSNKLGFGSAHADVYHWFNKYNKDMDNVRNDVATLMGKTATNKELYRIRKTWEDAQSQVGAYADLVNAKAACDKAGKDYEVYNSEGVAIYPVQEATNWRVGDKAKLKSDAHYITGGEVPSWVKKSTIYVREIRDNGDIVFSVKPTGKDLTGVVSPDYLIAYGEVPTPEFQKYIVSITANTLNVRAGAGTGYRITTQVRKNDLYTIIDEKDGWGKLKSGAGWISLQYTRKIKNV